VSRPLILVAASGLARECVEAVRLGDAYEPVGFVDDNSAAWGTIVAGLPVLGGLDVLAEHPDAAVLLCTGKGTTRRTLANRLLTQGVEYATVIHPSVTLPPSCSVGPGSVLLAGCVLTASVRIGAQVVVMPQVTLTHDNAVSDYGTLCAAVTLGGSVTVGEAAYLGMASAVREGCRIGAEAMIGMGAVVLNDVPDGQTWVGNPARPLVARSIAV
jgi:sugar O-acyltransferase (sialic acid O-acetyltransferase NeuD family)